VSVKSFSLTNQQKKFVKVCNESLAHINHMFYILFKLTTYMKKTQKYDQVVQSQCTFVLTEIIHISNAILHIVMIVLKKWLPI
jgi:Uma2 family endonuclease